MMNSCYFKWMVAIIAGQEKLGDFASVIAFIAGMDEVGV